MLRKIRLTFAIFFFVCITLLFLDFTGTLHTYLGWMAKIQFLPAVLALNVIVIIALIVLTLLMGRIYCSVICPMGVMQDIMARIGRLFKPKNKRKLPYSYSPAKSWLRYSVLGIFIIALIAGIGSLVALIAPYSSFGRIVANLFQPLYIWVNNIFAYFSERANNYTFYNVDVWMRSLPTFIIAAVTFVIVFILAARNGRTYCNTICPVGTVLGFLARFSWFKPAINPDKCIQCGKCSRNCKAACIDFRNFAFDYSRCVTCGDCITTCDSDALHYVHLSGDDKKHIIEAAKNNAEKIAARKVAALKKAAEKTNQATENKPEVKNEKIDNSLRSIIATTAVIAGASIAKAQQKAEKEVVKLDGGYADIIDKVAPKRATRITPPGSKSIDNMYQHCTACQLCVAECPNEVLRPSTDLMHLMQPVMSYERGYCRPECNRCSQVCPAGAITPITVEDKTAVQIGHAVWNKDLCIVNTDDVECGNCARHCPSGAITMVPKNPDDPKSHQIPTVNEERCIGCGACENLCPSRPISAIYVEGHEIHRTV
ncbi:MAG: 4Fe-4S binding protein [Phocaeicola sp.]|uniref:4Fe-4S binding protein n=1 Tax=Phocaeicola sp. TaxID=2773926 RepID=UPI003F9F0D68